MRWSSFLSEATVLKLYSLLYFQSAPVRGIFSLKWSVVAVSLNKDFVDSAYIICRGCNKE